MSRFAKNKVVDFFSQSFSVDRTGRGAPATRMLFLVSSMLLISMLPFVVVDIDAAVWCC